jgi:hypothetical protein
LILNGIVKGTESGMQGKRLPDGDTPREIGDYCKAMNQDGSLSDYWHLFLPNGQRGFISGERHKITEHEDGTITVQPSILHHGLKDKPETQWHGFLERGIWRTC